MDLFVVVASFVIAGAIVLVAYRSQYFVAFASYRLAVVSFELKFVILGPVVQEQVVGLYHFRL